MLHPNHITITECDDWCAVYKGNKRVWNTHSCHLKEGLEALGIPFTFIGQYNTDPDQAQFPELLEDLVDGDL